MRLWCLPISPAIKSLMCCTWEGEVAELDTAQREMPACCFGGQDGAHANREIVLENVSFNGRRLLPEQIRLEKSPFDEVALK